MMIEPADEQSESRRFSRAQILKAAGLGVVAASIPGVTRAAAPGITYAFYPQVSGTYSTENLSDIARVLHTSSHLAAGVMYTALQSASLNLKSNALLLSIVQGALVEHQRHAEFLDSIGNPSGLKGTAWFAPSNGVSPGIGPTTSPVTLTLPAGVVDSPLGFFSSMEWLETLYTGMYIAAIREFSELGQPLLAKWMAQILGVIAGLRVLARTGQDLIGATDAMPPNNKAFETDYVLYVRDVVPVLVAKGYLNGSGQTLPIFSPAAAQQPTFTNVAGPAVTAVVQQRPNNATSTDVGAIPNQRT